MAVHRLVKSGDLPHVKIGSSIRITVDALDRFVTDHESTDWKPDPGRRDNAMKRKRRRKTGGEVAGEGTGPPTARLARNVRSGGVRCRYRLSHRSPLATNSEALDEGESRRYP